MGDTENRTQAAERAAALETAIEDFTRNTNFLKAKSILHDDVIKEAKHKRDRNAKEAAKKILDGTHSKEDDRAEQTIPESDEPLSLVHPRTEDLNGPAIALYPHHWQSLVTFFKIRPKTLRQLSLVGVVDRPDDRPPANYVKVRQLQERKFATKMVAEGEEFFKNNNVKGALDYCEKAVKMDGTYVDGWYLAAKCFYHTGEMKKAIEQLDNALRVDPDHKATKTLRSIIQDRIEPKKPKPTEKWDILQPISMVDEYGDIDAEDDRKSRRKKKKRKRSSTRSRSPYRESKNTSLERDRKEHHHHRRHGYELTERARSKDRHRHHEPYEAHAEDRSRNTDHADRKRRKESTSSERYRHLRSDRDDERSRHRSRDRRTSYSRSPSRERRHYHKDDDRSRDRKDRRSRSSRHSHSHGRRHDREDRDRNREDEMSLHDHH